MDQINLAEMFFKRSSIKIVQAIMIRQKNITTRGGSYFPYIYIQKTLKSCCQKPLDRFQYSLTELFLW